MKADAIVYTSQTGHTEQYARLLGQALKLPVYSLDEAAERLPRGSAAIYLGWLCASRVKGFAKAAKRFRLCAVCGVGMFDTGAMTAEVRRASGIPSGIPLFTLQGGVDKSRLKGVNKLIIDMLIKGLSDRKERSAQDEQMLELLTSGENLVSAEKLDAVLNWCREERPE